MYFNYHAKAQKLIREGRLVDYKIMDRWNAVSPALVLFFDGFPPMPVRSHKWKEYFALIAEIYGKPFITRNDDEKPD